MKILFILFFILLTFTNSSQAKVIELKKKSTSIFIQEISNWKLGKELFGLPHIYFSPLLNGQRSNISFTDTGATLELDINDLASSQNSYQGNKNKWAEKVGATVLSFLPYEVKVTSKGYKAHEIGFTYMHENLTYNETSYYIECRGKIIFSKSLRLIKNISHEKDFNSLISNLDCGASNQ
jgi:hypothetical protein